MSTCEDNDFLFPMKADVYYAILKQNSYGQAQKEWVFDRTIVCNATPVGGAGTEDIKPEVFLANDNKLVGRVKQDVRLSSNNEFNAITNILVTNIRYADDSLIYTESAGPRSGRGTIYEIGTFEPFSGAYNAIEYYKILLRRAENQAVGD